jgi:hypothetical protein
LQVATDTIGDFSNYGKGRQEEQESAVSRHSLADKSTDRETRAGSAYASVLAYDRGTDNDTLVNVNQVLLKLGFAL